MTRKALTLKTLVTAFACFVFGSIFLAIRLTFQQFLPAPLVEILKELTSSLIVAAIFLTTIEIFHRTELLREIEETLSKGAEEIRRTEFSKTLSDRITPFIFYQVDEFIIKTPYLLRDMKVNLEFQPAKPGYLKLIDTTSFKVENLTTAIIKDELPALEDSELTIEYPQYPKITRLEIGGRDMLDDLNGHQKIVSSEGRLTVLLPLNLAPNSYTEISFTIEKIVRDSDSDIWNVTFKTVNLSICCTAPQDMQINAYPVHPDRLHFKPIFGGFDSALKRWDLECGLLPYQGIHLLWRPRIISNKTNS